MCYSLTYFLYPTFKRVNNLTKISFGIPSVIIFIYSSKAPKQMSSMKKICTWRFIHRFKLPGKLSPNLQLPVGSRDKLAEDSGNEV